MSRRLTILAGAGALVPEIISGAKAAGDEVQVLPLVDRGDLGLSERFWVGDLPKLLWRIKSFRSTHVTMVGGLKATAEDRAAFKRLAGAKGKSGDATLLKLAERMLGMTGARVIGAESIVPEILVGAGPVAGPVVDPALGPAIAFALEAARAVGRRDLGQAVVTMDRQVIAEEDIDGTDALLDRVAAGKAGRRAGDPLILAKAVKPQQSRLSDRPAIGPETVRRAAAAGVAIIAVEAGGAILVDRPAVIAAANEHSISIVGIAPHGD